MIAIKTKLRIRQAAMPHARVEKGKRKAPHAPQDPSRCRRMEAAIKLHLTCGCVCVGFWWWCIDRKGNVQTQGGSDHVLRSFLSPSVLPVTRLGGVFLTHRPTFGKMFLFIEYTHTHYVKVFFCLLLLLLLLPLLFCSVAFLLLFVGCVLPPRRKHVHIRSRKRMKRNREAEHAWCFAKRQK